MNFNMYIPTKIIFGKGKVTNLHFEHIQGKRGLVVISNGNSTKKYGYLDRVCHELFLMKKEIVLFD